MPTTRIKKAALADIANTHTGGAAGVGINESDNTFVVNGDGTKHTMVDLDQAQTITGDKTFTGTVVMSGAVTKTEFADGTVSLPSITFSDDLNSGIYRIGADNIGVAVGGASVVNVAAAAISPGVTNTQALGTTALMWMDLFLASGAVVNFDNGDVTLTHAANAVTLAGGTFNLHTSGSPYTFTEGTPAFTLYTTNASTSGSTSAESFLVSNTQTGIGGVGGRARFYMTTNVALAGWSNALKSEVVYGASGRTTGLGSALLGELTLSAGTTSGTYAALEAELNAPSSAVAGTAVSFLYMNATDTAAVINSANGYLFEIGVGVTDTAGGIFEAEVNSDSMSMTHVLKIRIAGTAYYIPLNTSKAF